MLHPITVTCDTEMFKQFLHKESQTHLNATFSIKLLLVHGIRLSDLCCSQPLCIMIV